MLGILLFNYLKSVNAPIRESTSSTKTEAVSEDSRYTVRKGETLWSIARDAYGSGYNWVDLAKANSDIIRDPNIIAPGMEIQIPKIELQAITHETQTGDTLWGIAKAYCGNGFAWTQIATDNEIENPKLLEPGQVLKFTCMRD